MQKADAEIFTDRWGRDFPCDDQARRRPRKGAFAVAIYDGKILLSWPNYSPDRPELPGGGVEQGESIEQALIREIEEEAGVICTGLEADVAYTQQVNFYANFEEEFWEYDQTYWLLSEESARALYFDGKRKPEDALYAQWLSLNELEDTPIHAIHDMALRQLLKDQKVG